MSEGVKAIDVSSFFKRINLPLYANAKIFAFPSLYEGFGLLPIEAMAVGVPTISYNNSSLTEIIGDAGMFVNNKAESPVLISSDNHPRGSRTF